MPISLYLELRARSPLHSNFKDYTSHLPHARNFMLSSLDSWHCGLSTCWPRLKAMSEMPLISNSLSFIQWGNTYVPEIDNLVFIIIFSNQGVWPPVCPLFGFFRANNPVIFAACRSSFGESVCGQSSTWQIHFYFWLKMVANEGPAFSSPEMSWLLLQPFILYFMVRPMNSFI